MLNYDIYDYAIATPITLALTIVRRTLGRGTARAERDEERRDGSKCDGADHGASVYFCASLQASISAL